MAKANLHRRGVRSLSPFHFEFITANEFREVGFAGLLPQRVKIAIVGIRYKCTKDILSSLDAVLTKDEFEPKDVGSFA